MSLNFKEFFEQLKPEKLFVHNLKYNNGVLYCNNQQYDLTKYKNIYLLAMGKGASLEYSAFVKLIDSSIQQGMIITKTGYTLDEFKDVTIESTHPNISEKSFVAAELAFDFVNKLANDDLLICLVSGGASALMESYESSNNLELLNFFNNLMKLGTPIDELNLLRQSFSKIKNGGLVKDCCADVLTIITSDIPNNDPYLVSSSPTLYRELDRKRIDVLLSKYQVPFDLKLGQRNTKSNRDKEKYFLNISYESLFVLTQELLDKYEFQIIPEAYNKSLEDYRKDDLLKINRELLNISFGELTINVEGNGMGGRCTHFVLKMADLIFKQNIFKLADDELEDIYIFSFGTDGSDGPTDAAGAWINYQIFQSYSHEDYLKNFDSYHYFEMTKTLLKSGPTGTNLMDVRGIGKLSSRK